MSNKDQKNKNRIERIGKSGAANAKKPLLDPRYKSFIETLIFLLVLLVFFIINNTRNEPDHGPYPPFYSKGSNNISTQP